ncbi:MAG TPA: hypothetical protein VHY20_10515, partial [Pirellulales bacterium]|nr:hypothetical protein [Pirellulales bacterium]
DWLTAHVIAPDHAAGNYERAARKKLAITGGATAVRAMLDGAADGNVSWPLAEADRLIQQRLLLDLKFNAALEMPLSNQQQAGQYIKTYANLQIGLKRLELEEKKLGQKCVVARQHHERELRRLELQQIRAETENEQWKSKLERRDQRQATSRRRQDEIDLAVLEQEMQLQSMARQIATSPLAQLRWGTGTCQTKSTAPTSAEDRWFVENLRAADEIPDLVPEYVDESHEVALEQEEVLVGAE